MTGLPTEHFRWSILESWKRITANITATVNSLSEFQKVFCWWYVIFTDKYIDGKIKTPIELHMVFVLVIC
jgi:hypothetical protein